MELPLSDQFLQSLLLPGDILLFDRQGPFNWFIKFKRGEKYSHCEVFDGGTKVFASRNGVGVGHYDLDLSGLAAIYRLKNPTKVDFNLEQGRKWFWEKDGLGHYKINGQPYDWVGLLSFAWASFQGRENGKMFCSEFIMRFYRACGVDLFNRNTDADAVSPGLLTYSEELFPVWLRPDKRKKDL